MPDIRNFGESGRKVPMFDKEKLSKMRTGLPEFAPRIIAEIESKSAELAKIHLRGLIQEIEMRIRNNSMLDSEDGDFEPYYENEAELNVAKAKLKEMKAELAELEANGHLSDRQKELGYAKLSYKQGHRIK
jgi:hypothetical protein